MQKYLCFVVPFLFNNINIHSSSIEGNVLRQITATNSRLGSRSLFLSFGTSDFKDYSFQWANVTWADNGAVVSRWDFLRSLQWRDDTDGEPTHQQFRQRFKSWCFSWNDELPFDWMNLIESLCQYSREIALSFSSGTQKCFKQRWSRPTDQSKLTKSLFNHT